MADEENENTPEPKKGMSPVIKIALLGVVMLMAAGGGLATWNFVLKGMLEPPEIEEIEPPQMADAEIPLNPVYLELSDRAVQLQRESEDYPASFFSYTVSLECNNQDTHDLINARLPRFEKMILELHMNLTRAELDAGLSLQNSIERQALQKCNDLLRRMQGDNVKEEIRITAVLHTNWTVSDN
jgi:flagellar basal body-associated protein FliL